MFNVIQMDDLYKVLIGVFIVVIIFAVAFAIVIIRRKRRVTNAMALTGGGVDVSDLPLKFPQVATLSNYIINTIPIEKFVWLEKTDGVRAIIMFENNVVYDITDIKDIREVGKFDTNEIKRTIFDTELYEGTYYVFDAIYVNGKNISTNYYLDRMKYAKEFINAFASVKRYVNIKEYRNMISWKSLLEFISNDYSPYTHHIIDGAICQRVDMPYFNSPMIYSVYKLKLPCLNTIDFFLKYDKDNVYRLYLYADEATMKTNMRKLNYKDERVAFKIPDTDKYYLIFISPAYDFNKTSLLKLRTDWDKDSYPKHVLGNISKLMKEMMQNPKAFDEKIVELSYAKDGWVPLRVREDKKFSNSYFIGCMNMLTLFDPVNAGKDIYFQGMTSTNVDTQTMKAFHDVSHILRQFILEFVYGKCKSEMKSDGEGRGALNVLDLAGGRGGDIYTLCNLGATNIFAVDADKCALTTYVKKRITVLHSVPWNPILKSTSRHAHDNMLLNVIAWELSTNNEPLIKVMQRRYEFPSEGFDIILMNYAFHYLCKSHKTVRALTDFVSKVINVKHGIFIVSYFDGEEILKRMTPEGKYVVNDAFTITLDHKNNDSVFALMPLPSIDSSGYRLEPLVTKEYIDLVDSELKLVTEFKPYAECEDFIKTRVSNYNKVKDLFALIKVRVYVSNF